MTSHQTLVTAMIAWKKEFNAMMNSKGGGTIHFDLQPNFQQMKMDLQSSFSTCYDHNLHFSRYWLATVPLQAAVWATQEKV